MDFQFKNAKIAPYNLSMDNGKWKMFFNIFYFMNDNRDANVQRLAAIVSERVQALLAISILSNARKSVESGSVFSLSFGTFLSLCLANKEKEKYIIKTFLSKNTSYFFLLYCDKRRKK